MTKIDFSKVPKRAVWYKGRWHPILRGYLLWLRDVWYWLLVEISNG